MFETAGAGHARQAMGRHPSKHRTDAVDYIALLKGEVTALMDLGDVTMRRGTRHGWVNRGECGASVGLTRP
jgi:hypothetical protein